MALDVKELSIHLAGNTDVPVLTRLSVDTFVESYKAYNTPENMHLYITEHFTPAHVEEELRNHTFFIARYNNHAAGYVKLSTGRQFPELHGTKPIEIERFYVLQQYQGNKIGAGLMQHCITYARDTHFDTLWLGVWEHNPKAINFYTRWGFDIFGYYLFKFGNDLQTDLLMRLKLVAY